MKKTLRWFFSFLALCQVAGNCACAETTPKASPTELPFQMYGGYLIVAEGQIGPLKNLRFVLDTGVTHTMVDQKVAASLHLCQRDGRAISFDKLVKTHWSVVPELEFGAIKTSNLPVMVGDLEYFRSFATHVDVLVGLDVLQTQSFSVDYSRKEIILETADAGPNKIPMKSEPLCLTVEIFVADRPLRVVVDTGVQSLVLYEDRLMDRGIMYTLGVETVGISPGGHVSSRMATLPRLRVGTRDIDRKVFLTRSPSQKILPGIQGFLGPTSLQARRVHLDFEKNTLSWTN